MAGYTEFQVTEPFISSLPKLLANDKSALTWNAGTSFPTKGLTAGMPCFRTDEQKLYIYDGKIWNVLIDLNDKPILASTGKYVAYDRAQTLQETEKAQARSNIGVVTLTNNGVQLLGNNVDYNTVIDSGFYHVNMSGATNGPGSWATKLIVIRQLKNAYITQVAFPVTVTNGAIPMYRISTNTGASWTNWYKFITDLKDVVGANASAAGVQGLVPAPKAGDDRKVLFGNGTWETAKVQVDPSSANAEQPIVLRSSTATTAGVDSTIIVPGVTVNPSTKTITAQKVIAQNFSGKIAWTDITSVPTNVKNAVSFVEGQTLTPEQAQIVRLKILTAYQTSNTGSLILPNGTIAQRDANPVAGAIRFNSEKGWFEGYTGTAWVALVSDQSGKNLPTGTCICGLFTEAPELFLSLDGSQIYLSDYYDLVNLLWEFETFRGDGSTYAVLPNMHHRFFEGTTTLSEVATYVEAGLPNITGKWVANKITDSNPTVSGALFNSKGSTNIPSGGAWGVNIGIGFDASLSSSIYAGNVVQPVSLMVSSIVRF